MFGFFKRRRLAKQDIFSFYDGTRWRRIDPLVAWRIFASHPTCDPLVDFPMVTGFDASGNNVKFDYEAEDRVLSMTRDMFGVKPLSESGGGLTVAATYKLLWDYLAFMDELKKKRDQSPTSLGHMDQQSSPNQCSTTKQESESSSTMGKSSNDEQLSFSKQSAVF